MRHKLKKDLRKRHEYRRQEEEKLMKRIVKNNQILGGEIREKGQLKYVCGEKEGSISRIRNRCIVTGRGRGVIGDIGVSRMVWREWGDNGKIAGVRRANW